MAARIRAARAAAKVTNQDLATAAGVHEKTVQRWQSGRYPIPAAAVLEMAQRLDVDPSWLLVGDHTEVAS
jgi:transcriptional regulator with XRE-family HTH domain